MITVSIFTGLCGPVSELLYLSDYWKPQLFNGWAIGIEDFLFGFFIGGIASVIYEVLFRKHFRTIKKRRPKSFVTLLVFALFVFVTSILFISGLNSIYSTSIAMILIGVLVSVLRKDLFIDSVMSGLLMGLTLFILYFIFLNLYPEAISRWWLIHNISGLFVWKVPVEELLWAFGLGVMVGPLYEFFAGNVIKKSR